MSVSNRSFMSRILISEKGIRDGYKRKDYADEAVKLIDTNMGLPVRYNNKKLPLLTSIATLSLNTGSITSSNNRWYSKVTPKFSCAEYYKRLHDELGMVISKNNICAIYARIFGMLDFNSAGMKSVISRPIPKPIISVVNHFENEEKESIYLDQAKKIVEAGLNMHIVTKTALSSMGSRLYLMSHPDLETSIVESEKFIRAHNFIYPENSLSTSDVNFFERYTKNPHVQSYIDLSFKKMEGYKRYKNHPLRLAYIPKNSFIDSI